MYTDISAARVGRRPSGAEETQVSPYLLSAADKGSTQCSDLYQTL